jgi:hypothetical protein
LVDLDGGTRPVIRIEPPNEPGRFDEKCRRPGKQWLTSHPEGDPPAKFWRLFINDLCRGFHNRCAYSAMWDLNGTVDHFLSRKNRRDLSYEWSNFRYVSGWLNSSKQALDERVLDPFHVRDDWFEVVLPSLVMRLTKCVPARVRLLAQFTLRRLQLDDGDRVYEQRRIYYEAFKDNGHPISWLEMMAPLVATAVRRERLLAALETRESVSVSEAAEICETSREHVRVFLHMWVRAEHLRSHGRGRGTRYAKR